MNRFRQIIYHLIAEKKHKTIVIARITFFTSGKEAVYIFSHCFLWNFRPYSLKEGLESFDTCVSFRTSFGRQNGPKRKIHSIYARRIGWPFEWLGKIFKICVQLCKTVLRPMGGVYCQIIDCKKTAYIT